jgi:predicted transcriptional regulator
VYLVDSLLAHNGRGISIGGGWGLADLGSAAAGFQALFVSRIASLPVFAYLEGMEVHFTPEQETQLSQIATHAGTDVERLVKDAALRLLQEEARFRAAVREAIAQADRGELIEEEEMDARLEQMLRS